MVSRRGHWRRVGNVREKPRELQRRAGWIQSLRVRGKMVRSSKEGRGQGRRQ